MGANPSLASLAKGCCEMVVIFLPWPASGAPYSRRQVRASNPEVETKHRLPGGSEPLEPAEHSSR